MVPVRSGELDEIDARARRDKRLGDVVLHWKSRGGLHGAAQLGELIRRATGDPIPCANCV
jgi:hypothetical protein